MYATVAERTGSVSVVGDAKAGPPHPSKTIGPMRPTGSTRHAPLRLTRRGRMAAATAGALVIAAISMVAASAAQATSHAGAGRGDLAKVMVASGQSLWSIAVCAEPAADPRGVIEQIRTLNSLSGYQMRPGEVLWVPKA